MNSVDVNILFQIVETLIPVFPYRLATEFSDLSTHGFAVIIYETVPVVCG